jgi:homoserine kinase type II
MNEQALAARLRPWGLTLKCEHPDIPLDGSPERAMTRTVVEDAEGRYFILERIPGEHVEKKDRIAHRLTSLREAGLTAVNPYWLAKGNYLVAGDGDWWQLQPYLHSIPVNRETYAAEPWRGKAMASFLIQMAAASAAFPPEPAFSLPVYSRRIGRMLGEQYPAASRELADVWEYLESGLFKHYDSLAMRFLHGDFHPLNMLWTADGIRAVIDWEFCGFKPELYDAALLVGCIGFDSPEYLTQPMPITFLGDLRAGGFAGKTSWRDFVDLVLAIRTGWLREWLVKKDTEALDQEVVYMQLLRDNRGLLEKRWGLSD